MKKGYQLYSARELCGSREGLISVLEKIAAFGYDGVEFFNYADISAEELKRVLDANHLEAFNSHVSLDRWRNRQEQETRFARTAGIAALSIPYILPAQRNAGDYRALLQEIPKYAAACEKERVKLCYHNHDFEFERVDGTPILDMLLTVEPLNLELDTFWAWFAGVDPVEYLTRYAGRIPCIHIKDYLDKDVKPPVFCAIGTGNMENKGIIEAASRHGVTWIVVEQDNSRIDPLESARLSIENLKKMLVTVTPNQT